MARDKPFNAAGKSAQSVPAPKGKSTAVGSSTGVSDELRQAVMDLGGDEEDMKLISGVDDDAEGVYTGAPGAAMKSTEVSLRSYRMYVGMGGGEEKICFLGTRGVEGGG